MMLGLWELHSFRLRTLSLVEMLGCPGLMWLGEKRCSGPSLIPVLWCLAERMLVTRRHHETGDGERPTAVVDDASAVVVGVVTGTITVLDGVA